MSFPFNPMGATANIAATTSSARVAFNPAAINAPAVRVFNAGTTTAFIAFGDGSVAATAASYPVGPGVTEIVGAVGGSTNVAAILASGTGTVYFTPGSGL